MFLADRTYAKVLRPSVVCDVMYCKAKVTIDSLQKVVYEKSIGTKMTLTFV